MDGTISGTLSITLSAYAGRGMCMVINLHMVKSCICNKHVPTQSTIKEMSSTIVYNTLSTSYNFAINLSTLKRLRVRIINTMYMFHVCRY